MALATATANRTANSFPAALANPISDFRPYTELKVSSLEKSVNFYSALFNAAPAHQQKGLALFDLENPQLSLILQEDSEADGRDGHFGVQFKYTDDVNAVHERLQEQGYKIDFEETEASCCFSVANKVWVSDPDKNLWEIYVLLEENATEVRCGSSCACEASGCG
jgi:catechol 2,3-dioxygenase-like lactoylglutathione lyase family enzyme